MVIKKKPKVIVAMSPQHPAKAGATGQAGGYRKKKKVIVAMSGGIDSSVAAALLKKAGFGVVGIFMRFWQDPLAQRWNRCCSPEAEKRARLVAASLGIPFYVLDLEKEFKKRIVDYFLKGYKAGLTPNPCVVCNKEIKFGLLLEKTLALGADFIATGHYARTSLNSQKLIKIAIAKFGSHPEARLFRGKDKEKDQSYFLWQLSQEQLRRILFPLSNLTKKEVISLAKKFDLPVLDVPESQEICFIETTVNDFLKKHLKKIKTGSIVEQVHHRAPYRKKSLVRGGARKIIDTKKNIIGQHQGLPFYTIGQRRGIGLAGGPFYVLDKDFKNNFLIVTKNEKDLLKKELIAENVNWISSKEPMLPLKIKAKIRYRQRLALATISKIQDTKYKILFERPQKAIAPGQSVVFYKGKELLGGGIIKG